ncbi:hypothetical protein QQX10_04445 [Demequina sp. SYSU T00039]|uniref:Uncharacterized protein n=1 Tax=Demequina lignilytica TaxID=3051663 RepID=A0AAW7M8X3_9MICO|nr:MULTISPECIES: hypothetical protein [unclassified Demequina]MDN4477243.1 hypothetical protein [Demequina sp. SYSU T00039-1]MDN4487416.1 hypothetical protein [Demequina sp. SYSU T00039]MDN4491169.1 hypothetical protein [Demequina sp. SYSU T00068]
MPWASAGWRTRAWLAAAALVVVALGLVLVLAETGGPASTAAPTATAAPATPAGDPELRASVLGFVPILAGYAYRADASSGVVDVGELSWAERPTGSRDCVALRRALDLATASDSAARRGDLYARLGYLQAVGGGSRVSTLTIALRVFADREAPAEIVRLAAAADCAAIASVRPFVPGTEEGTHLIATEAVLETVPLAGPDLGVGLRVGPEVLTLPDGRVWRETGPALAVDDRVYLIARGPYLLCLGATDVADPDAISLAVADQLLDHLGAR